MPAISQETFLLLDAVVTIVGLIVLITRFRLHPFIALIIAAGFLGLTSGMPVEKIVKSFQEGFGSVLGFVGVILALGTMLGKLMAESGGADQIARTLIRAFGKERIQWSMMFAAFLVGIPLFFEIGFVLLIPLVFIVARRTGVDHRAGQRGLQQRLVRARDADGDRLGLVLDRVDGARELLDGQRQAGGEVVEHDARGADLPELALVRLERHLLEPVAQQRRDANGGARLEVPVVRARAQTVVEDRGLAFEHRPQPGELLAQLDGPRRIRGHGRIVHRRQHLGLARGDLFQLGEQVGFECRLRHASTRCQEALSALLIVAMTAAS